ALVASFVFWELVFATTGLQLAYTRLEFDVKTDRNAWSQPGGTRMSLGGLPVRCQKVNPDSNSEISRVVYSTFGCPAEANGYGNTIKRSVTVEDAFCYTPFFKRATVPFTSEAKINWSAGSSSGANIKSTGTLTLTMVGLGSCRQFNQKLG